MKVRARDVMQSDIKSVPPDLPLPQLQRRLTAENVGGFPVLDDDTLVGVVSASDVIRQLSEENTVEAGSAFYQDTTDSEAKAGSAAALEAASRTGKQGRVCDVMSTHLITIAPDAPLHDVAAKMAEHGVHRLLVTEGSRLVGVVSSLDVVRICGRNNVDVSFQPPPVLDF